MEDVIEKVDERVIIVKVNKTYKPGMSSGELYDCTRGIWKVQLKNAKKTRYALAVYFGKVLEVFEIEGWYKELTTDYEYRKPDPTGERFEFVGKVADEKIREKYIGKYLPTGYNTIQYFNV
jgi:hypothetical protein